MLKQGFDYRLGMMIVLFSADVGAAVATADGIFSNEDYWRVLRDGLFLVTLDNRHEYAVVDVLPKTGEEFWSTGPFHKNLIMRWEWATIKQSKAIMRSKISYTSFLPVCQDSAFVDTMMQKAQTPT